MFYDKIEQKCSLDFKMTSGLNDCKLNEVNLMLDFRLLNIPINS